MTEGERICTWQTCDEPAIVGQPYCQQHADLVTPERLRAMLMRAAGDPVRRADAARARAVAARSSADRRKHRRNERAGRAASRPAKKGRGKKR